MNLEKKAILYAIVAVVVTHALAFATWGVLDYFHDKEQDKVLTIYGANDIYYANVDKLHIGTESGRVDTTFTSFLDMALFLDELSANDTNDYDEWAVRATIEYTEVHICGSKVSVVTPDVSSDTTFTFRLNASDTLDDGSVVFYSLD